MVRVDYVAVNVARVATGSGVVISYSLELRNCIVICVQLLSLCDRLSYVQL
jgi:hypothetical protein